MERVEDGSLTLEQVVRKTSHAPAILYQVAERGFLREGYFADITLIEPNPSGREEEVLSKCGWSPFAGYSFKNRIAGTWVNGHQRYDGSQVLEGALRSGANVPAVICWGGLAARAVEAASAIGAGRLGLVRLV
jgi:dihydroorotase